MLAFQLQYFNSKSVIIHKLSPHTGMVLREFSMFLCLLKFELVMEIPSWIVDM